MVQKVLVLAPKKEEIEISNFFVTEQRRAEKCPWPTSFLARLRLHRKENFGVIFTVRQQATTHQRNSDATRAGRSSVAFSPSRPSSVPSIHRAAPKARPGIDKPGPGFRSRIQGQGQRTAAAATPDNRPPERRIRAPIARSSSRTKRTGTGYYLPLATHAAANRHQGVHAPRPQTGRRHTTGATYRGRGGRTRRRHPRHTDVATAIAKVHFGFTFVRQPADGSRHVLHQFMVIMMMLMVVNGSNNNQPPELWTSDE